MKPYRNANGRSDVAQYEFTDDSIQVVFKSGVYRHYLYDHNRPGRATVEKMKQLATRGSGLNACITAVVGSKYVRRW